MAWNTDKLPTGIKTPADVLDPALAGGKIGVTNPSGIPTYVDMYRQINDDWGPGFVDKLAAQKPRVYDSAVAVGQAIASGEIWRRRRSAAPS